MVQTTIYLSPSISTSDLKHRPNDTAGSRRAMEVQLLLPSRVLLTVLLVGLFSLVVRLCNALVLEPKRLRSLLAKQGIKGPPPTFLLGNLLDISRATPKHSEPPPTGEKEIVHNCAAVITPFLQQWSKEYGTHPI